jgi:hypothetical protein
MERPYHRHGARQNPAADPGIRKRQLREVDGVKTLAGGDSDGLELFVRFAPFAAELFELFTPGRQRSAGLAVHDKRVMRWLCQPRHARF